jgi:hypothetical protein
MKPEDFAGSRPELSLEQYFLGHVEAWGIFEDRFGRLRRSFTVQINGSWEDGELVLDEAFCYDDGETDRRVWRIRKLSDHHYEGRADDVIGVAQGVAFGKALNWRYQLDLPIGERTVRVHFDDWMYLQPGDVLVNRAKVSKFGITLGEVSLFFRRVGAESTLNGGCG